MCTAKWNANKCCTHNGMERIDYLILDESPEKNVMENWVVNA